MKDLEVLLRQGESERLEFKTGRINEQSLSRYMVAFANTEGGRLVVGVTDDGILEPLAPGAAAVLMARVTNVAEALLPGLVKVSTVELRASTIVVIDVAQAPSAMSPLRAANGNAYVRDGTSVRKIEPADTIFAPVGEGAPSETARPLTAFLAMSFRTEEVPALEDYFQAMLRAAKSCEYTVRLKRMDLEDGDYEITGGILDAILSADFVIADFTLNSNNVYYEAGIARGAGKYTIRTALRDTELPFDVRTSTVSWYVNATTLEAALEGPLVEACRTVLDAESSSSSSPSRGSD